MSSVPRLDPVILEMTLPGETGPAADLLGVWRSPPAGGDGPSGQELAVVWRAEFPAKARRRRAALASNAYLLRRAGEALPFAESYLAYAGQAAPGAARPYSLAAPDLDEVERQLEHSLGQARQIERLAQTPGAAYATPGEIYAEIKQAVQDTLQFYENLRRAVAHMAWVETVIGGQMVGRTSVGWLGDFHTSLQPRLDPAQAADHRRLVQQALASRQAILRMGLLVAVGAAGLATSSLTGPLAIIGVLNFVKGLINVYQQVRSA
jgi:hypothetical protein